MRKSYQQLQLEENRKKWFQVLRENLHFDKKTMVLLCVLFFISRAWLAGGMVPFGIAAFAAAVLASAAAPVVNTGLFILGGLFLVGKTLDANLANFGASGQTVVYFLVIGCAGLNFIAEFLVNLVVSPAIHTIVRAVGKKISK